ncbi:MAG: dihydrofolate reductase [Patescibacteria group bacterium]
MNISIIAAIGKNNELGKGNDLVFKLPADMKRFKELTTGHTVIMGRKTFESIGKALPNRRNIVITHNKKLKIEGSEVAHSFDEAIKLASKDEEVFIIGGSEVFKKGMESAHKLYITEVKAEDKDADVFFPEIIPIVFMETFREENKKDAKNPFDYDFVTYERFF